MVPFIVPAGVFSLECFHCCFRLLSIGVAESAHQLCLLAAYLARPSDTESAFEEAMRLVDRQTLCMCQSGLIPGR